MFNLACLSKKLRLFLILTVIFVALISDASPQASCATEDSPGSSFAYIPANPSFSFALDLNNKAPGEAAPIYSAYWLCKNLVTNSEYKQFLDATNSKKYPSYWSNATYPEGKADHPVLSISLNDAQNYCTWLHSLNPSWNFRLPTEAELENEAAGSNHYQYPWGNQSGSTYDPPTYQLSAKCNYNGVIAAYCLKNYGNTLVTYNNPQSTLYNKQVRLDSILSISSSGVVSGWVDHTTYTGFLYTDLYDQMAANGGYTSPVGSFATGVSEHGCYDIGGDAWSWTSSLITAMNGAESGQLVNAIRGGSWYATLSSCKSTYRGEGRQASGNYATVGFRVAANSLINNPTPSLTPLLLYTPTPMPSSSSSVTPTLIPTMQPTNTQTPIATVLPSTTPVVPEFTIVATLACAITLLFSAVILRKKMHG
jgi:formylglycine-generating enzyme required for sulfatase activity